MTELANLFTDPYVLGALSVMATFLISSRMYPVIIYTVRTKNLMDEPGDRSTHGTKTPTLGGVGLFAAFAVAVILFSLFVDLSKAHLLKLVALLGAIMILLFLGMKDDLIALSPSKKFSGQLFSSAIVIFATDVKINSFSGILGIGELPYMVSILFTLFVFILIINAFNLIDGIDGLAGSVALIASAFFGIFFLSNGNTYLVLVSFVLIGAIAGFLRFNLSDQNKLFMGDSGSMFIGYLLAYQGVSFVAVNQLPESVFTVPNAPILFIAILSFPLLDTLRVFLIRITNGKSPFRADRNHIHHRLIHLGLEHKRATLVIGLSNIFLVVLVYMINDLRSSFQLLVSVGLGITLYLSPFVILKNRQTKAVQTMEVDHEEVSPKTIQATSSVATDKQVASSKTRIEVPVYHLRPMKSSEISEEVGPREEQEAGTPNVIAKRLEVLKKIMVKTKEKNQ